MSTKHLHSEEEAKLNLNQRKMIWIEQKKFVSVDKDFERARDMLSLADRLWEKILTVANL